MAISLGILTQHFQTNPFWKKRCSKVGQRLLNPTQSNAETAVTPINSTTRCKLLIIPYSLPNLGSWKKVGGNPLFCWGKTHFPVDFPGSPLILPMLKFHTFWNYVEIWRKSPSNGKHHGKTRLTTTFLASCRFFLSIKAIH